MTPFPWKPGTRFAPKEVSWPPTGVSLHLTFKPPKSAPKALDGVTITVHYELYQGVPVFSKWLTIADRDAEPMAPLQVTDVTVEFLAVTRPFSPLPLIQYPPAQRTSDSAGDHGYYSNHGMGANEPYQGLLWVEKDQPHAAEVTWQDDALVKPSGGVAPGAAEPILNVSYSLGYPDPPTTPYRFKVGLDPSLSGTEGGVFTSFRALELVLDSTEKERSSLSMRRMRRLLAPAVQENPIFMHLTTTETSGVKTAVDQMSAVGFEMIMFSFGSGFDIESSDPAYISMIKEQISYAKSKDIEVGAYDLIALTRNPPNASWAEISPVTGKPDGNAAFASHWKDYLTTAVDRFINETGLSAVETDGPYGGEPDNSTQHAYHKDLGDSIFRSTYLQAEFYRHLKSRGVYIHQPDNYFYFGASKTGMGYNENQFSLSRWEDLTVSRAGMFDDTYYAPVTQGWMFVPLIPYHAGGSAASFAPMSQHIEEYEWAMAQYFGFGVMPCWRGPLLYDTPEVEAVVKKWVSFYKEHRMILTSDIIHVRRADNQGVDGILHVNSGLTTKGLAVIYNPTSSWQNTSLPINLYYTGLVDVAKVSEQGAPAVSLSLARDYSIELSLNMPPRSATWFTIE